MDIHKSMAQKTLYAYLGSEFVVDYSTCEYSPSQTACMGSTSYKPVHGSHSGSGVSEAMHDWYRLDLA